MSVPAEVLLSRLREHMRGSRYDSGDFTDRTRRIDPDIGRPISPRAKVKSMIE